MIALALTLVPGLGVKVNGASDGLDWGLCVCNHRNC